MTNTCVCGPGPPHGGWESCAWEYIILQNRGGVGRHNSHFRNSNVT